MEDLHPYTTKLLRIRAMQAAGYPYGKDDLTMDEWLDLGRVKEMFERAGNHEQRHTEHSHQG